MEILVKVHPNSKNPRIKKKLKSIFHFYVSAPPLGGKANKEVIELLAKFLKIRKKEITLLRGEKSRSKVFKID